MGFWPLFFIFLVIVMAVGPIMMFKPGKKMQALDKLRSEAARRGLRVRMANYSHKQDNRQVAVYLGVGGRDTGLSWTLLRKDLDHDIHFHGHWDWLESKPALASGKVAALKSLLDSLPDTVVGIEALGKASGVWWLETGAKSWGLDELESTLKRINEAC